MIACSAVHINEITCSGEEGPKTYLGSHKAYCRTVAQEGLMYSSNQLATVHTLSTLFAPTLRFWVLLLKLMHVKCLNTAQLKVMLGPQQPPCQSMRLSVCTGSSNPDHILWLVCRTCQSMQLSVCTDSSNPNRILWLVCRNLLWTCCITFPPFMR